jgi:hypothetical protein
MIETIGEVAGRGFPHYRIQVSSEGSAMVETIGEGLDMVFHTKEFRRFHGLLYGPKRCGKEQTRSDQGDSLTFPKDSSMIQNYVGGSTFRPQILPMAAWWRQGIVTVTALGSYILDYLPDFNVMILCDLCLLSKTVGHCEYMICAKES